MLSTSENVSNLFEAFCKAQSEIGHVEKDKTVDFFAKGRRVNFRYTSLDALIVAIKKPFKDNNLAFMQIPINSGSGITVGTRIMHSSGEYMASSFSLQSKSTDPKDIASVITFASRYSLKSMVGIAGDDLDLDSLAEAQASNSYDGSEPDKMWLRDILSAAGIVDASEQGKVHKGLLDRSMEKSEKSVMTLVGELL